MRIQRINFFLLALLLFPPSFLLLAQNPEKHIVGGRKTGGFFSNFLMLLCQLSWCEKNNKIPVVHWGQKQSLYYGGDGFTGENVWEYYFEPLSSLTYQQIDKIDNSYSQEFFFTAIAPEKRQKAYQLITKYIKIKSHVMQKVEDFYQLNMAGKKTIGIHLRGTDKEKEEDLVNPKKIVKAALAIADSDTQFLIASDEQRLFDKMLDLLKGRKIIYYDCFRSDNGNPLHFRKPSPGQLGQDVLIEALLLS
ncbi:MAG: hypothetical protein P4L31_02635, partial [Candidatus Babeliales bacterium]|nr:hypothetical protein [Candidatus Babeliales bacterium]